MKTAVIFFLSLCFLLLKGNDGAYDLSHQNSNAFSLTHSIEKSGQVNIGNKDDLPVVKNLNLSEKKEEFISVEDDDDSPAFTRKYVLLAKYFTVLTYAAILIHCFSYFKSDLPFCGHFSYISSYKYILQRVLRL